MIFFFFRLILLVVVTIITNNTSLWSFKVKMQKTVKNEVSNIHCVFALTEHVLLIVYITLFSEKTKIYFCVYLLTHE